MWSNSGSISPCQERVVRIAVTMEQHVAISDPVDSPPP